MFKKKINLTGTVSVFLYLLIGSLLLVNFPTDGYSEAEQKLYITLIISYFIVMGLVVTAIIKHHLYIFEPFTIITLLYCGIFILRPIQDLFVHDMAYGGQNLVGAGVKSTVLFTVGYMMFYLGYYVKKNENNRLSHLLEEDHQEPISLLVLMWAFFFVACLVCQFSQGMSLRYIFSLGASGEREINGNNSLLLFLSNFATSLLVVWMMIIVKSNNKAIKIIVTILTAVYLIMRNSRWLVLIMIFSPVVYYYTKRKKSPRALYLLSVSFIALTLFAWMQLNRYNIAMGRHIQGFGEDGLTFRILMSPFDSDLTTYTTFYGMIRNFPSKFDYFHGRTFLYVFLLFIPRILWPGKPDNPVRDMIEQSLGTAARMNGRAVSNIGEFYANFGVIGIILLMFVFGYIVFHLRKMYEEPTDNRLIMYSVLYPLMFQWAARGNFSSNFYYTLFAFIPFIVIYIINHSSVRRKQ